MGVSYERLEMGSQGSLESKHIQSTNPAPKHFLITPKGQLPQKCYMKAMWACAFFWSKPPPDDLLHGKYFRSWLSGLMWTPHPLWIRQFFLFSSSNCQWMDPLLSTYYKCLKNPLENFQGDPSTVSKSENQICWSQKSKWISFKIYATVFLLQQTLQFSLCGIWIM
jgi:hypothetical protein